MQYHEGSLTKLGDIVTILLQTHRARTRVVMLGDTGEPLNIDKGFIEWIEQNPLAQTDQKYTPVGNYMLTGLDCCVSPPDTSWIKT